MTEKPLPIQATYAHAAVNYHARIVGDDPVILGPEHPKDRAANEMAITDFLANLHHLCELLGLDYDRLQAIANLHFEQECYERRSI